MNILNDGTNQIVTTDPPSGGYLWSFPWMNVEDGAAPSLVSTTFVSSHQNGSLAVVGDTITVDFESNEELLDFPTVKIYAVGGPEGAEINATMVGDRYHWTVSKEMTSLDNVSGLIKADFTIEDLNYNEDTKTVTSTIVYKAEPATEVWVDPIYTAQANVPSGKYWLWDAFATIQDGIDGVADPGTVIVLAGTTGIYEEDFTIDKTIEIRPYWTAKGYDVVTLKGVATVPFGDWPLADPNIDIQATGVSIHNFKIEAPDYVVGFYSSGIVIGATNVTIYLNEFYATSASNTDDICQSIQTYNGVDVSGLNIYTNTFTHKTAGIVGDWGYEGIYINPGGTGLVNIEDNTLGGKLFRAITAQRSNCNIEANNISTDLNPASDDLLTAGAWVGIWAYDDISDIVITGNTVQGTVGGAGFNRGIRLGHTGGSTFTNLSVTSNEIYYNKNGIYSQSATGITITGNAIVNNTLYGIFCDTGTLNAENNWWGSGSGPDHVDNTYTNPAGEPQGDVSSDYVDYVPWYDLNMSGTSFAPIHKDDGLKAITYFSSFQAAIDAVVGGGETIESKDGTFTEDFTVDKDVTIQSENGDNFTNIQLIDDVGIELVTGAGGCTIGGTTDHGFTILSGAATTRLVQLTHLLNGVTISYNSLLTIGNASMGVNIGAAGSTNLTISNNDFNAETGDGSIWADKLGSNATISNNAFTSSDNTSGYAIEFMGATGTSTISGNTINNYKYGIGILAGADGTSGLGIAGNTFDDCDQGIMMHNYLGGGSITTLNIASNTFLTLVNPMYGIVINDGASVSPGDFTIIGNDFAGCAMGIDNLHTTQVVAEDNWWGSGSGPDHADNTFTNPAGDPHGVIVSNNVDYVPWMDTDMYGTSFAPVELWEASVKLDKNKLREENLSFKDVIKNGFEQFSSIQTAIDAYDDVTYDWAGIGCYAGTFTEDFVADKDDIWFEGEYTKQLVTLLGDQEVTGNDVWFDYFEFDPQAGVALLLNSSAAPIDGTWIYGCTFTIDESGDVGIYVGGSVTPNAVTYTDIENNVFNGPTDMNSNPWKVGGWFGTNISCAIDGIMFSDNEVNKGSIPINLVDANINDIWIYENDFYDTDGVIYFWNSPASSPTGILDYFVFENNYVPSSNSYGIAIGGASLGGPTFTDVNFGTNNAINDNAFEMVGTTYGYGAVYMADQYTGLLDASNNWWGDQYGPLNDNNTYTPPAAPKGRATVSDRVEFAPWYNAGTNAATGRGWYPAGGTTLFAPVINVTASPNTYHSSIQRAIDVATASDEITCLAGTFTEDIYIPQATTGLEIRPNGTAKSYDDVTIKGVATLAWVNWPLADPNIVILASGTKIHHFTIESPDVPDGYYSSGMVIDGTNVEIYNNDFVMIGLASVDPGGGVAIQTYRDNVLGYNSNITGLYIHDNTFSGTPAGDYVGTFINHQFFAKNGDYIYIEDNDYSGYVHQGIVTERDYTVISGNTITRSYSIKQKTGYGIIIQDWDARPQDDVEVYENSISNFAYGILIGRTTPSLQTLTNIDIHDNDINQNDVGVKVRASLSGVTINYNNISGNDTYGVENATYGKIIANLNAEKNWWGDATGPFHSSNPHNIPKVYGDGDVVNDGVDFIPWYATSTVTPSTEYVRTHGSTKIPPQPNLAFADVIQACIDAAADVYYFVQVTDKGAKISVPYTENLTVDNQAYIYGGGDKATPPVTIIGTHVITGDNVTFDGFTLTPGTGVPGTVITINSASQLINYTTIKNCQFDIQTSPSIGVYVGGGTPTNAVINTEISSCTFNGPTDMISNPFKVGGSYGSPVGCQIVGLYFIGNYVNYGSIPINLADRDIVGLEIYYNDFANTDGVIYFWAEDAVKSPAGVISDFWFYNNFVNDTNSYGVGFDVYGNFTSANYGPNIYINENYFGKNIPGAYGFDAVSILTPTADLAGYVIDATNNWWGTEDGPDHVSNTFNVPTQGVAVSDNVDFVRWYDSELFWADPGWIPTGELFAPVRTEVKGFPYFSSIQAAIDAASSGFSIICYAAPNSGTGTFYEDFSVPASKANLHIYPYNIFKGYDDVTIKGQATVEASLFPLAGPNIEILGSGTSLEGFTIEAPDYVEGFYSSGIVVGATWVTIEYNTFINNAVATADDISQSIQTYLGVDCSILAIVGNTFTDNVVKTSDWGYEGIYINPGCGSSGILGNIFLGMCLRAITIEDAGASNIWGNNIQTSMAPVPDDWSTPGAYQGINLQGDLSNIDVYDNYIGGNVPAAGFAQGIRLGSDGDTFTDVYIEDNEIRYNSFGILCKTAGGVTINYNIIDGNAFGVQNDDTTVKTVLHATYNYWGATDGPSFIFDYGMGSGSGDLVSEYVDFYPWYVDDGLTTEYLLIMDQFLLAINPASPYVDNYFDLRVCAADADSIRDFSYGNLADFSSSHAALTVPEEQLLVDGFKEIVGGCISAQPFEASDHLTIYAGEYNNNPWLYPSELTDIVIQELNNPDPPDPVNFTDLPNDNGGWILVEYTLSPDDPFFTPPIKDNYGVSYYVVEIDTAIASGVPDWHFLANIACYDNGSGTNDRTALLPAPASDTEYNFRMASVYNPTKLGGFDEKHISYEEIVMKDGGAQSTWQTGSAAPKDNLPAYADFTVFLEGPYNVTNHNMDALNSFIPLSSPYDGETVSSLPAGTVDWLQIQLRTTATGTTEKTANAFLLYDGSIVDVDGNNSLPFYYTTGIDYYIVISHRNHLDIMTATGKAFGDFEDQATLINLSVAGSVYGNGFKVVETDVYAMYAGDANDNGQVQNDDLYDYWSNQVGQGGYLEADFNLNGQVQNDDRYDFWKYNVGHGSSVPGGAKGSGDNGNSSQGEKSIGITFTFANGVLSGGYYEFDVMVAGSAEGTKLGSNQTYINYSTTGFGENIAANNKVTVEKGTMLQGDFSGADLYRIENVADNTTSCFAVTVTYDFSMLPAFGNNLPTTATQLLHVKIEIANPAATSDLCFEQSLMATQQYESDNSTKYDPINVGPCLIQTLPVELSAFNALYNVEYDNIILKWTTASETDVQGFNIYRSECDDISTAGNRINYSLISLPETGTTTNPIDYSYEDIVANVYSPYYYWLEVVDYGGTSSFHGSIVYTPGDITGDNTPDVYAATRLIGAYPNPAHNSTTIKYQLHGSVLEQNTTIKVYNILGKCVKTVEGRNGKVEFDVSDLGSGIYFYQLKTSNYNIVKKLIVIR